MANISGRTGDRPDVQRSVTQPPLTQRPVTLAIIVVLALAFPFAMQLLDGGYYVSVASRIMIYAIAATSLNLILGYGGLVSFGHAAFVGIGAYVVGILITEGVVSGWIGFPLAMLITALAAVVIGAVSLRTRGVYFIMITLAFAQMVFYLVNSAKMYGGDEGLNIKVRSDFGVGLNLKNDAIFYFLVLLCLAVTLVLVHRLMGSRFGRIVLAMRDDDTRAEALGVPTFRYKLVLFVISAALGGLAGALLVNQQNYVNPNVLDWTQSGTLMVMVILGGVGTLSGGVLGAIVLLVLEEVISAYTEHWQFWVGWILLAIVLFAPGGLLGLLARARRKSIPRPGASSGSQPAGGSGSHPAGGESQR